jgi:hypothetical protein
MMDDMKFFETEIRLSDGSSFTIVHNLPEEIEAAAINWQFRTDEYTAQSLCDYINGKRERGLTNHYAFTKEQFDELNQKDES